MALSWRNAGSTVISRFILLFVRNMDLKVSSDKYLFPYSIRQINGCYCAPKPFLLKKQHQDRDREWTGGGCSHSCLKKPCLCSESAGRRLGECFKTKPEFMKAWEKWRFQITKLSSAFWVDCEHHQTKEGLKNLLQIMLGNTNCITTATCHWIELCVSHLLYVRPFTLFAPLGGEQTAAQLPGDLVSIGHSSQWMWYSVYASKQVSWGTRMLVVTNWTRKFIFGRDSSRI